MRRPSIKYLSSIALLLVCGTLYAQFTTQGYTTNMAGGVASSTNYSTEIAVGDVGSRSDGTTLGFYLGYPSFNLKSAVVTMQSVNSASQAITDNVDGYIFRILPSGLYDTLGFVDQNPGGDFDFPSVFQGDYLVLIDSDPEKYVATYFGDAFEWENAQILTLEDDITIQIIITDAPGTQSGQGEVSGTIEEDFGSTTGRIDARRRAAGRKCGLKKRRSGGRTGQNDEFELIAYGETNENGEFEYGFLPEGTYRFFVEYPGIPLDESSFVEFEIGEAGVSDDSFVLAVFASEEGISIELVLGLTSEFFTNFKIYPNPTSDMITISYDKIISENTQMEIVNAEGKTIHSTMVKKGEDQREIVDVSDYPAGQYFIRFTNESNNDHPLVYRFIKR